MMVDHIPELRKRVTHLLDELEMPVTGSSAIPEQDGIFRDFGVFGDRVPGGVWESIMN